MLDRLGMPGGGTCRLAPIEFTVACRDMCPTPTLRWAGGSAVRSARRLLDIDVDLSGAGKPSASLNVNFQSTPFTLFNGFEVLG